MPIEKTMLISPVVDMESIILNMMKCENITEDELKLKKEIETSFGESLSWQYLSYVRKNTINWNIPTNILFADNDNMTSVETMTNFANKINIPRRKASGYVVLIRWLQSALIPFVTTQSVGVLNPPHE